MAKMTTLTVHTDGACRGNPGASAIAYHIGGFSEEEIEFCQTIGVTTNNQAEYRAMVAALEKLNELGVSDSAINFFADSELMIKQITGVYRVKDAAIQPVFLGVKNLITSLEDRGNKLSFTAVRRENNKRADYLANCALDNKQP